MISESVIFRYSVSFSQVWHPARECDRVRPEHWHRALRGPGFSLWERRSHPPLPAHLWHESGLPRHQEDLLLWRLPKVSALCGQMACVRLNVSQTSTERHTASLHRYSNNKSTHAFLKKQHCVNEFASGKHTHPKACKYGLINLDVWNQFRKCFLLNESQPL